jgi:chromosome segregation ATPase
MRYRAPPLITLAILIALPLRMVHADADTETRLRDALRNAITQQRAAEDERAALLAKQSESDKQIEALRAQVDELTKAGETAKKSGPEMDELNHRLSAQTEQLEVLNQTLEKWKAAYNEAASVARAKEGERAKLATDVEGLTQRATNCETKNAELFKVGNEILGRYANVSFGDVIAGREPFIGIKRVELQNLVQDYQGKLLDQKAAP